MREKKNEEILIPEYRKEETTQEKKQRKEEKKVTMILTVFVVLVTLFVLYIVGGLVYHAFIYPAWTDLTRKYYYEDRKNYTIEEWKDLVEKLPPPEGCRVLKVEREVGMGYDPESNQYTKYAMGILFACKLDQYGSPESYYYTALDDEDFAFWGRLPQYKLTDDSSYTLAPGEKLCWVRFVRTPDPDNWWQAPEETPLGASRS